MHTLFALDHNAICEQLRKEEKRAWGALGPIGNAFAPWVRVVR